jgi:acetyl-CoA synthetase
MPSDRPIFGRDVPGAAWRPSRDVLADARLTAFLRSTGEPDLEALQARAVADPGWFWGAAADDLALDWQRPPTQVLDASGGPEWTRWWRGGAFNHAIASLDRRARLDPDGAAVDWEGEDGAVRRLTNEELRDEVVVAARMFAAAGVRAGDRVGVFLPMLVETVVATLALGRIGAIFTPIFSGYGAPAVATRLQDCEASLLVTADGFLRRGKAVEMKAVADAAVALAPSVRRVLVVRRLGEAAPDTPWTADRDRWWDEAIDAARAAILDEGEAPEAPETDPETPYMLIYTSGTTGRPKGAVHVHGGFPVKAAQDLAHTFDLRSGDALFWFTDLGWMMGPWAISGSLLLGARLVLYEGAPDFPAADRLWALVERHRVTHLGLSPTVVRALIPSGPDPIRAHDLRTLRVLGSTGEPWVPASWWWYFREVGGGRCPVVNFSGGNGGERRDRRVHAARADQAGGVQRPVRRDRRRRRRWGRGEPPRRRGRARDPSATARDDPWLLAGSRPLRRDVLEPVPWHVGPRRLGDRRRRRLLVHPRPVGRHAQGRRQARGTRRGRGRGHGPPGRRRGRRDRCPARGQGRGDRRGLHASRAGDR